MLDLAHIGERIRECRKKKMMTIRVLGEYTGLSAGYLSMLEQNKTSPNVDSLARICEALDIDIQYALEGEMPGKTVIHREEMSKHLYPEENMTTLVRENRFLNILRLNRENLRKKKNIVMSFRKCVW